MNSSIISRCNLIEFSGPCLNIPLLEYTKFPALFKKASSAIGFIIGLGEKFCDVGIQDLDNILLQELKLLIGDAIPRVLPSYAIML